MAADGLPGNIVRGALAGNVGDRHTVGHEWLKEPAAFRAGLLLFELTPDRANLLAQFDSKPDRVVPQHFAGASFHHLGAHIQRGEQRVERRSRRVLHKALVEAPMFDPALLAFDMAVLDVDL